MVRRRRGWSSSTPHSPLARLTRCSTTSTLLNPVNMFMTRCWKQEEVKVVEVELLPLFVQLFLVSCLRQLSWGKHRHSHLLLISLFPGWQALQCLTRTPSLSSLSSSPLSSGSTIASLTWLETFSHSFLLFIFWYFILFRVLHFLFLHTFPFPFIFPITSRQSFLPPGDHWEAVELPTSNPPAWPDKLPGQSSKITNYSDYSDIWLL